MISWFHFLCFSLLQEKAASVLLLQRTMLLALIGILIVGEVRFRISLLYVYYESDGNFSGCFKGVLVCCLTMILQYVTVCIG